MHRFISLILAAFLLTLTAGCVSPHEKKPSEQVKEYITHTPERTATYFKIGKCQAKIINESGIAKEFVDRLIKIVSPNDRVKVAKKLGYKKIGKNLKRCINIYLGDH